MSKLGKSLSKKNDGLTNNGARQKAMELIQSLIQDLKNLTDAHNALANATQKEIDGIGDRLDDVSIILQSISTLLGVEKVNEEAKKIRIDLSEKDVAAQEKKVEEVLSKGQLKTIEAVTESSLVVSTVKRADGTQVYPRKSYLPFTTFKPEIQAIVKDKKVNEKVELPDGSGIMEILEIYEEVKQTEPEQPKE